MDDISWPRLGLVNTSTRGYSANAEVTADGRAKICCQKCQDFPTRGSKIIAKIADHRPPWSKNFETDFKSTLGRYSGVPRINIAIFVVGSRGDVQPFVPIAQLLTKPPYSHRVRICTHPAFKELVEDNGLEFFSIGGDPASLMAYMVKNPGLMPGIESLKAGDVFKRRSEFAEILEGCWRSCIEAGDGMRTTSETASHQRNSEEQPKPFIAESIIANPPSYAHIHCAEKLGIPLHMMFTMPWSPTQVFPHPLASLDSHERDPGFANFISYSLMELLAWQGLGGVINTFRANTLHLDPVSPLWGHMLLSRLKIPFTYLWSPTLIAKPMDWPSYINITGFSFLEQASTYEPPEDLVAFLNAGPPPVYIGFGSVVVEKPDELTDMIFAAVKQAGVRALVSKGWGGFGGDEPPEGVMLIGNCPHDWLFKHVSCVVHHGGAGTTAIGIAMGIPTVIVPFFGDQPFWGAMIHKAGAGPEPIPFRKMTVDSLADSITQALDPKIQAAVEGMSRGISSENGATDAVKLFHQAVNMDSMRCRLAPDRVAAGRIRKTNIRLSLLAISTLIDEGYLHISQIKLDWYIDEGAVTPAMGVLAVASGVATKTISLTSDYKKSLFRAFHKKKPSATARTLPEEHHEDQLEWDTPPLQHPVQAALNYPQERIESVAQRLASKTLRKPPDKATSTRKSFQSTRRQPLDGVVPEDRGMAHETAHGTWKFASGMAITGLKVPVALFYNLANGFHNAPSFYLNDNTVRKRDKITGLGSGLKVAGEEFVLGIFDGTTGLVSHPYCGARERSLPGFLVGIGQGLGGLVCKTSAAAFGLPGYTLKGVEKQFSKRKDRDLQAKILAARLRQSLLEFRASSQEERDSILKKWKELGQVLPS